MSRGSATKSPNGTPATRRLSQMAQSLRLREQAEWCRRRAGVAYDPATDDENSRPCPIDAPTGCSRCCRMTITSGCGRICRRSPRIQKEPLRGVTPDRACVLSRRWRRLAGDHHGRRRQRGGRHHRQRRHGGLADLSRRPRSALRGLRPGAGDGADDGRRHLPRRTRAQPDPEADHASLRPCLLQPGRAIGRLRASAPGGAALLPLAVDDARPDAVGRFPAHPGIPRA